MLQKYKNTLLKYMNRQFKQSLLKRHDYFIWYDQQNRALNIMYKSWQETFQFRNNTGWVNDDKNYKSQTLLTVKQDFWANSWHIERYEFSHS